MDTAGNTVSEIDPLAPPSSSGVLDKVPGAVSLAE
jgi:hypothetical protein